MDVKKEIKFGAEARNKLMEGIDTLADAVVSTLGPNGRNVLIDQSPSLPQSTKDGVTVAKNVVVDGKLQNLGVQVVKAAAMKTADKAGDGTTTSTLLAREMIKAGLSHLNNGVNAVEIKRGIDNAVKQVIEILRNNSEDISSEEQLEQVATISANNDVEVGKLIATALEKVGRDGVVHIEESKSGETYLETVEGMQFNKGYKSHFFVTDNNTMTCKLEDAYILIANYKFTNVKELLPILEQVSATNKSLLIIADDVENEALATLIVNKARGTLKVAAVKAPDFGDRRKLILEDIATVTGGVVFDPDKGMKLDKFSWDWFGQARAVTISKEETTIVDGKGDEEAIEQRVSELQSQIEKADTPYAIEQLQNRLAKMVGGVSIIHVGGFNETEMGETKDRVDDALHATKAALEEGIVPGGGAALLYAREGIKELNNIGSQIVYQACGKPFEQILINAGYSSTDAQMIGKYRLVESGNDNWAGYNLKTEEVVNMKEAGIIDPTKVTRTALENAASVAGTLLLTECTLVPLPEEKEDTPSMGMGF
jgi:chaperonin GroEL|uniref:Chaperonin GroEL n=1 Tax=uncultured virus TaxID=340016 RepID=A0A240F7C5_9VIRU|nr:chaperonin GroEL [uncultured virus]